MGIITKFSSLSSNRTTYAAGALQARAYGVLTRHTSAALAPFGLIPKEWALLGLVKDLKKARPTDVAEALGVEAAYITVLAVHLKKMGLLTEERDQDDTRSKMLCLSNEGNAFVRKCEPIIRNYMTPLLAGVAIQDVLGYLRVLEQIIKNEHNIKK